jgi:peptidoglycan/LPS O-acetylase OafA/YrhL
MSSLPAAKPVVKKFYLPQLDGVRFIAFFLVFLRHNIPVNDRVLAWISPSAQRLFIATRDTLGFGLSLFFFLSSYLITSLLILEKDKLGTINLPMFYVRRILRVWPLYFALIAIVSLVGIWREPEHMEISRVISMVALSTNWYIQYHGIGPFILGPLWSIAVEEQFYVVWPTLFKTVNISRMVAVTALVALISLAATAMLVYHGSNGQDLWVNSLSEALFFAVGGLLALVTSFQRKASIVYAAILGLAGAAIWLTSEYFTGIIDWSAHLTWFTAAAGYLGIAIGCCLILLAALHFPASLVPRWLVYLGKISYGLYMFSALAMYLR